MRLIDADTVDKLLVTLAEELRESHKQAEINGLYKASCIVEIAPTVDPVKHGRWDLIDACEPMRYGCSVCHRMVWHHENYCPNCGAKMDEEGA